MKRKRKKLVYTAGPYRSKLGIRGIVENIQTAEYWMAYLWWLGVSVICPHKNTALLDGAYGMTGDDWLDGDFVQVERCDAVFLLPNWQESSGALQEIDVAEAAGIPIFEHTDLEDFKRWMEE